jgi:hypothetical protein
VVRQISRQKGFVAEAGCFANVQILRELGRRMNSNNGGAAIQLDVSVPHEALGPALARKGIPKFFVDL